MPEFTPHHEHDVQLLPASRRARGAEALAQAFAADPMWGYMVSDPEARPGTLRHMFDALIRFRQAYGAVYSTPEVAGVACWGAPGCGYTLWRVLRTGLALPRAFLALGREGRWRALALMRHVDQAHKQLMPEPHWYLEALGVVPACQGQGIGGALLQPILARADAERLPCYLEAVTERNAAFYLRRGFRILREQALPEGGLTMWYMSRNPFGE